MGLGELANQSLIQTITFAGRIRDGAVARQVERYGADPELQGGIDQEHPLVIDLDAAAASATPPRPPMPELRWTSGLTGITYRAPLSEAAAVDGGSYGSVL